jgi:hypothetical protein
MGDCHTVVILARCPDFWGVGFPTQENPRQKFAGRMTRFLPGYCPMGCQKAARLCSPANRWKTVTGCQMNAGWTIRPANCRVAMNHCQKAARHSEAHCPVFPERAPQSWNAPRRAAPTRRRRVYSYTDSHATRTNQHFLRLLPLHPGRHIRRSTRRRRFSDRRTRRHIHA